MDPALRVDLETRIRTLCERGDERSAAEAALGDGGYGPEIRGFLVRITGNWLDSEDVFGQFAVDVVRGLPNFTWRSSFRTWAYALARNAAHRHRERAAENLRRRLPLSDAPESALLDVPRSDTAPWKRTDARDRLARLCEELGPEDKDILVLHLDRGFTWAEIAGMFLGEGCDEKDRSREASRLRKRFQLLKERLRKRVEDPSTASGS